MNTGRIMAIFEKDLKEFTRNMMLFTSTLIPVVLAFMYRNMGGGPEGLPLLIVYIVIGVAFSAILCSGIMTMMAEENEKETLRGLVQSPASMMDIIIGKSLVVTLMTVLSLILSFMIMDGGLEWSLPVVIGIILLGVFFINLGVAVGLEVKSVATTSVYLLPIMFLFGFTPMIEVILPEEGHVVRQIAEYFPLYQNYAISDGEMAVPFIILALWVAASFLYVIWIFRKRMKDEAR